MLTDAVAQNKQRTFFRVVFGKGHGIVGVAKIYRAKKEFSEEFFKFPEQLDDLLSWIAANTPTHDLYFCPQLLDKAQRVKENVSTCTNAWADLDSCMPTKLLVNPSILVETSTGRYQGYWIFDDREGTIDPGLAEDISRRIAYFHKDDGADPSGWDLTQLLRIPQTLNFKYPASATNNSYVNIKASGERISAEQLLEAYPRTGMNDEAPLPDANDLPDSAEEVLERHRKRLVPAVWQATQSDPDVGADWSKVLWLLEMNLFEAGLTREEVFVVCKVAPCNKYARDGRSPSLLWKEVCRAYNTYQTNQPVAAKSLLYDSPILTDAERAEAGAYHTIVEDYIEWAKTVGDAAEQYHQAGGFVLLSSLVAGRVRLPTSFGTILPNLWFMILADTTLTRKTTAMDLAMDLLQEIDEDALLATDGSLEGLFTALSNRPGRPSVFLRDEFSGLIDAMTKKDYMAGMAESLTKLYDGKFQKRILKKETIEVREPVLVLFAGGIKTRTTQILNYEHVASGFLPRFIFISAESDITKIKPLGPPTSVSMAGRDDIKRKFVDIHNFYAGSTVINLGGKEIPQKRQAEAQLTSEAWDLYARIDEAMLKPALEANNADMLTPTMARLAISGLKAATLIAASETLSEKIVIEPKHLLKAFSYVETWREYALDILNNLGKSQDERRLQLILENIQRRPGIRRAELMQNHHLNSRDAGYVLDTLEQRQQISRIVKGRGELLYAI